MKSFNYENKEVVLQKGGKTVRKVSIKKGKGFKTVTKYRKGKKVFTVKKPIHKHHISMIKRGKFIPGLFKDCKKCKTKKRRGGSSDEDSMDLSDEDNSYNSDNNTDYESDYSHEGSEFNYSDEQRTMLTRMRDIGRQAAENANRLNELYEQLDNVRDSNRQNELMRQIDAVAARDQELMNQLRSIREEYAERFED